ncbi:MAG: sigma-70 family RNA polymerase sigma factor [Planctomycetota bacterium]|nr:MAG: sigma-70 family RNA polymerase sigma factor [Planctomycetota bacterium]
MHPPSDPASAAELERLLAHSDWLRRLARALVADPHAADDVVQDAWVAALERKRALRVDLGAWMRGAVRNLALRRRARDADRPAHERRAARSDASDDARTPIERMELQRWLADALLALDEPYRSAVILRHVEGLDPAAIAARQRCSRDAARQRIARGLARLRERLDDHCGGHALAAIALGPLALQRAAPAGQLGIGGWIVGTKSIVAACALLVAGAAAWLWLGAAGPTSPAEPREPTELAAVANAPLDGGAANAAASPSASARDAVLAAESANTAAAAPRNPLVALLRGRVVDPQHAPVAGAKVDVRRPEAGHYSVLDVNLNRTPRVVAGTTTGPDGRFEFELERGIPLDLAVAAVGYCDAHLAGLCAGEELEIVLDRGCRVYGRITRARDGEGVADASVRVFAYGRKDSANRVARTDAEGFYELRFSDLVDPRVEVSSGRYASSDWQRIELDARREARFDLALDDGIAVVGTVRAAGSGAPIAGAVVGEGWTFHRTATTDEHGRYRLEGFAVNGWQELYARAPGFATAQFVQLPAAENGEMRADFELARGHRARGRVVDGRGEPIAGAYVGAVASEYTAQGQDIDWISTRCDEQGRFELDGLDPKLRHCALVSAEGHATKVYDFPAEESAQAELDLGDLPLEAPALIAGRVVDEHGEPIVDASVTLSGANADRGRFRAGASLPEAGDSYVDSRSTRSDATGAFAFGALAGGGYRLSARRTGRPASREQGVTVAVGEIREDVVIAYPRGEELRGRIVDAQGRAVAGIWVSVRIEKRRDGAALPREVGISCESAADGTFVCAGLVAGDYSIDLFAVRASDDPDAPWLSAKYTGIASGAAARDFAIERGVCIRGRVVDASGAALVGYAVAAQPPEGALGLSIVTPMTVTDEHGDFAVAVHPARLWRVEVRGAPQSQAYATIFAAQDGVASGTHDLVLRVP